MKISEALFDHPRDAGRVERWLRKHVPRGFMAIPEILGAGSYPISALGWQGVQALVCALVFPFNLISHNLSCTWHSLRVS